MNGGSKVPAVPGPRPPGRRASSSSSSSSSITPSCGLFGAAPPPHLPRQDAHVALKNATQAIEGTFHRQQLYANNLDLYLRYMGDAIKMHDEGFTLQEVKQFLAISDETYERLLTLFENPVLHVSTAPERRSYNLISTTTLYINSSFPFHPPPAFIAEHSHLLPSLFFAHIHSQSLARAKELTDGILKCCKKE